MTEVTPAAAGPALTYAELIHAAYRRHGERIAFVSVTGERLTYAACGALLNRLTRALHARGVGRGTGVAFLASNRPELSLAVAAVLTLGGRVSLLPPLAGPERLARMLDLAAVDALVVDPLLESLLPALRLPGTVLGLGPGGAPTCWPRPTGSGPRRSSCWPGRTTSRSCTSPAAAPARPRR